MTAPVEIALSAVIQVIDGFTGLPAEGADALFTVGGRPWHPHRKPQAFHAFTGLERGEHDVTVAARGFFPQHCTVTVPPPAVMAEAVVTCTLAPDPLYPFPPWIPLVRGQVRDGADGRPLAGVAVDARYSSRGGKARRSTTSTSGTGSYDGHYALPLTGRLGASTPVVLTFSKTGYADQSRDVTISSAAPVFVDVAMVQA